MVSGEGLRNTIDCINAIMLRCLLTASVQKYPTLLYLLKIQTLDVARFRRMCSISINIIMVTKNTTFPYYLLLYFSNKCIPTVNQGFMIPHAHCTTLLL